MLTTKNKQQGFTIIEVLIVLAIAGLMMLIVFLAVPALQRNSRNTTYKNDASAISGAVTEFTNNNSGKAPTASASGTANSDAAKILANAKTSDIKTLSVVAAAGAANFAANTTDTAILQMKAQCPATMPAAGTLTVTTTAGASRQAVLLYIVESGSGNQIQCLETGL